MFIIIQDNWLQKQQCTELISYYEANKNRVRKYDAYFPLVLQPNELPYLQKKLNDTAYQINKSKYSYCGIVKWQPNTELKPHRDFEHSEKNIVNGHSLASVVYLNDNYRG